MITSKSVNVCAKTVLFVLGQNAHQTRIEFVARDDARPCAFAPLRDLREREEQLLHVGRGFAGTSALGSEDSRVERDRLKKKIEDRRR